jgi:hypothetical protein
MRFTRAYVLSAAASALLSTTADAEDRAQFAQGGNASRAAYNDAQTSQEVVRYPQPHWTSGVGTGTAATLEQQRDTGKPVQNVADPPGPPAKYPEPHWTSRIGTSTAAMFER